MFFFQQNENLVVLLSKYINDFLKTTEDEFRSTLNSRRVRKRIPIGRYSSSQALRSQHNNDTTNSHTTGMNITSCTPVTTLIDHNHDISLTTDANHNTSIHTHRHRRRRKRNRQTTRYWRRNNHNIQLDTNSVINLSNTTTLSHDETQLLARGLTFCPTPRQIDWTEVKADINDFCRRVRLFEYFHDFPPQTDPNPFRIKGTWTPPPHRDPALDAFIEAVEHDILNITPKPVRDNLTTRERDALKQLRRRTDIIIKSTDRGSGTVIMDRDWYINECKRQLNDIKFYRLLDTDITCDIQTRIRVYVQRMHKDNIIDDETKRFLIHTDPKAGRFYILPKIHKQGNPGRPIVSTEQSSHRTHLSFHRLPSQTSCSHYTEHRSSKTRHTSFINLTNLDVYLVTPFLSHLTFLHFIPTFHITKVSTLVGTTLILAIAPPPP